MESKFETDLLTAQLDAKKNGETKRFNDWFVSRYAKFLGSAIRICDDEQIATDALHRLYFKLKERLFQEKPLYEAYAWRVLRSLIRDLKIAEARKSNVDKKIIGTEIDEFYNDKTPFIDSSGPEAELLIGIQLLNEIEHDVIRLVFQIGSTPVKVFMNLPFHNNGFENWPIRSEGDFFVVSPSELTSVTLKQVGNALGLSQGSVSAIKNTAIAKLRRFLQKNDD